MKLVHSLLHSFVEGAKNGFSSFSFLTSLKDFLQIASFLLLKYKQNDSKFNLKTLEGIENTQHHQRMNGRKSKTGNLDDKWRCTSEKYGGGKKNCITLAFSQQWDMWEVLVDRLTMNTCEIMQILWTKHLTAGIH